MTTKDTILARFKEAKGDWISGESLSNGLSISRSAIWKHIRKLREEGYIIQSSPRKGYMLKKASDMLLPEEIRQGLTTRILGKKEIHHLRETVSTNTFARELASNGAAEGTLVVSETQTGGKGRLGRTWFSPFGEGIYLSFILRPAVSPAEAPKLTLMTAVALAETLHSGAGLHVSIKWPNDILIGGKKLAGILTEISTEMDAVDYVVIGLGINVNTVSFPSEIRENATSILIETGKEHSRSSLMKDFLKWFEEYYELFQRADIEPILDRWRQFSQIAGRRITVENIGGMTSGTALDIDKDGFLMVEDNNGQIHRIYSGDITLNGDNA
ncbi:MAG: biotin--[acetyl-CoA-carboxylase] ligase [Deltaproteobacteria bacterium]|nr:biotin--[acetyl-CoA-carboxylase] ligase [Deltaproteobacteria bacterium]